MKKILFVVAALIVSVGFAKDEKKTDRKPSGHGWDMAQRAKFNAVATYADHGCSDEPDGGNDGSIVQSIVTRLDCQSEGSVYQVNYMSLELKTGKIFTHSQTLVQVTTDNNVLTSDEVKVVRYSGKKCKIK